MSTKGASGELAWRLLLVQEPVMARADELREFCEADRIVTIPLVCQRRPQLKRSWLVIGDARDQSNVVDFDARKLKRK